MTALDALPLEASGFLLLFARVGAVLMLLPVFSEDAVPGRIRLLAALALTAGLWGLLSPEVMPAARDAAAFPARLVAELVTGLALGMLVRIMFLAIASAGSIVSLQIGLTSALVVDPSQGGQATVISKLMSVAAAVLCMTLLVHHLWIAAIVRSYAAFPVGGLPPAGDLAELAVRTVGRSLSLALGLAAPLIVYGIVFNVALGLSARLAPAVQVFFVAQPLAIVFGLGLTLAMTGTILTVFAEAMAGWTSALIR